jgi:hypothetical protein
MRSHGPARAAVVIRAWLLPGARGLAFGPGARGGHWRQCLRMVAVCAALALGTTGLAAAPAHAAPGARAQAAAAGTPISPVNPGGDFSVTMNDGGVPQTTMSQVVSTTVPESLGLSANPSLSSLATALWEKDQGGGSGATKPPSFTGGTVTVTASTVTVTVTASSVPTETGPPGPSGALAAFITGIITALITYVIYGSCAFLTGFRNQSGDLSDSQRSWCLAFSLIAANSASYALDDYWGGFITLNGQEWSKIFIFGATQAVGTVAANKYLSPWVEETVAEWGSNVATWFGTMIAAKAPWLGTGYTAVSNFFLSIFFKQPTAGSTMNSALGAAGMATQVAAGTIEDRSLGEQSECMEAYGAQPYSYEGERAAINVCNGTSAQNWIEWTNGRGSMLSNDGLCLDITGSSWHAGAPLQMYECNGQWNQSWWQQWSAFLTPQVQNPTNGLCVDDPNWNTDPGTQLQDDWCNFQTAQRWLMPGNTSGSGTAPQVTNYGPVDSGLSGECMDAYGSSNGASPGQVVAINNCDGNQSQDWTVWSDGTIRAWNLCLDTSGSGAGATVRLEDCDGAASQDWAPGSSASLRNNASGLCLEDPGASTAAGTQLDQAAACTGAADERWTLPGAPPGQNPPPPPTSGESVCDIYASYGTPCAAAYSMTRALYSSYDGPLYQVQRASDSAKAEVGLLATGGDVDASGQDSFCAGTTCTITEIYDQSPRDNNLTIEPGGGAAPADNGADATALPVTIGGHEAYGLDIESGTGYRDDSTSGIATGSQPEGMYMVASGTHVNSGCCYDFGNVETNNRDDNAGRMDAVNLTTWCGSNSAPCTGSGPWVEADLENGQWMGNGSNPADTGNSSDFVTAVLKNNGTSELELEGGDSTSGGLKTWYDGALPSGYSPMYKQGAIVLGTGGDNSNSDVGSFFEGVMTEGFPSDAADAAVQANIVAAGYAGNSNPTSGNVPDNGVTPSAAGPAVVHSAGATGAGAAGFSSVYTVDAVNGHLQETYLPYMGASWTTQDLAAIAGTPPVMPGTKPVALVHCGYTSVFTVDTNGDVQETYLSNIGNTWATHDLTVIGGTPPTNETPTAVVHYAGATGVAAKCGFTSVYSVDAANGDLQETYLPYIGDAWTTQDLSAIGHTPPVQPGTSPVAVVHCGYTSVYTVDQNHQLQETYLPAIGDDWTSQSLSALGHTPLTTTTPTAVVHYSGATGLAAACGFTSVYTVDQGSDDLQETYLPYITDAWTTQDLSAISQTPPVAPGTQPVALYHTGYTSVFTVDRATDHVQETYLSNVGNSWATHDLSAIGGAPPTDQTPTVLLHPDASGNLTWTSVYTINELSNDLQETYLAGIGSSWITQDLSAKYQTPPVYVLQSSAASWSLAHAGYTSAFTEDASDRDLQETYLSNIGNTWATHDLHTLGGTPTMRPLAAPVALYHDGYTSVFTEDDSSGDLQETYLSNVGGTWASHDLHTLAGTPPVQAGSLPSAVNHSLGYISVFTVDDSSYDLQETYLSNVGNTWATHDLHALAQTPSVMPGTSPVALYHDGYTSVYTVDSGTGDLQETYLAAIGGPWVTQDLTAKYHTPATNSTPTAIYHDGYASVYTLDARTNDLQETYLPAIGDDWTTQNLTAIYQVPAALPNSAPAALYHTGYVSVYYISDSGGGLEEAYLTAIGGSWQSQALSNTPTPAPPAPSPLVHYAPNGGLTWTSVYTIDYGYGDLQESYLPAIGDSWTTQDLTANPPGTPPAQ